MVLGSSPPAENTLKNYILNRFIIYCDYGQMSVSERCCNLDLLFLVTSSGEVWALISFCPAWLARQLMGSLLSLSAATTGKNQSQPWPPLLSASMEIR